jgi:glucose-1-phosphate adenylyltransferase
MGVYAFASGTLRGLLALDAARPGSLHDFGYDVIPLALRLGLPVYAYPFDGYWRDIGTPGAYWAASMDLLSGARSLVTPDWPAVVRLEFALAGAADLEMRARALSSVVFPRARIAPGAIVRDSVVLPGAVIERAALVTRAVVDEGAVIGGGAHLGRPFDEITVIGARTRVAAGPVRSSLTELLAAG